MSEPLNTATLSVLRRVSAATLTSQLLGRGLRNTFLTGVAPLRPDLRLVGVAFTVRYVPAREDLETFSVYDNETNIQRIAVESVEPGQVLVIDARGETGAASLGHILATRLRVRGAAGLVTDGALRDSHLFTGLDLPVYAAARHAATSSIKHHPADLNVPVACAGVLVMPGDVLVGDAGGVIVVPRHMAEEVAIDALEQEQYEEFVLSEVNAGASIRDLYPATADSRRRYGAWRRLGA